MYCTKAVNSPGTSTESYYSAVDTAGEISHTKELPPVPVHFVDRCIFVGRTTNKLMATN